MAKRIKTLASLIPNGSVVADIGCDHAYLIIELLKNNQIKYAYAIDNKDGPIKNAKNNIKRYNLEKFVEVIKANGLSFPFNKKINTLVFAGLGGNNVIDIINKDIDKLKNIDYIITDIHRDDLKVQKYLLSLGFKLTNSVDIIDKQKKYHLCRYENK